ncbi:hypothetical protein [Virgibacillus proomii]|uniref:hypothetical protein n=1 Tax=Virgibacillus proomii TaxID=84407 RepID=UPI001C104BC6|nr:hypothetical protein [Virgibacillus proomii]MBU5267881.1 hypothetical protein [Virgibacillus proomii]
MGKIDMYMYVNQLDENKQEKVLDEVSLFLFQSEGLSTELQKDPLKQAKNSRLIDLAGIVDFE